MDYCFHLPFSRHTIYHTYLPNIICTSFGIESNIRQWCGLAQSTLRARSRTTIEIAKAIANAKAKSQI